MLKVYILVCDRCGRMFDGLEESFNIPLLSARNPVADWIPCQKGNCMWYFAPDCAVSYLVSLTVRVDEIAKRLDEMGKRWST
jgi:hypothetical protein